MTSRRSIIALAAAALVLGGCATYHDGYAYDDGYYYDRSATRYYDYGPRYYDYGPGYYAYPRYYAGPSLGLSFSYGHHWRRR